MDPYAELCAYSRHTAVLTSTAAALGWDEETYMPPAGAEFRARQNAALAELAHDRKIDPRLGDLIAACEADPDVLADPRKDACVRELHRDYDRARHLPSKLVAQIAGAASQAQHVWKEARRRSDFAMFAPFLATMVDLTRQKAACFGTPPGGEPYDALLDEYEPGARAADLEAVFTPMVHRLSTLIAQLNGAGQAPDQTPLRVDIDEHRQHRFNLFVIKELGFDLDAGRLDTAAHPFCSGLGPGDTRLTTRYNEQHFTDSLYSTMHECGHGLYEQGLPKHDQSIFGTPLTDATSLGIHESQSRLWENFVGRSRAFWQWALPHAQRILGPALAPYTPDDLFAAVNTAQPTLIRVEADEATYNLHIMLRFEIERALFTGDLDTADVPAAWNDAMQRYLALAVPDDRGGCLQDVHWSFGLMGYFPTYALGNLYAAQLWQAIETAIPDLTNQIKNGNFLPLKQWLNTNIHVHGRRYRAAQLCEMLTGRPLSAEPFMRYLENKLRPVFNVPAG